MKILEKEYAKYKILNLDVKSIMFKNIFIIFIIDLLFALIQWYFL